MVPRGTLSSPVASLQQSLLAPSALQLAGPPSYEGGSWFPTMSDIQRSIETAGVAAMRALSGGKASSGAQATSLSESKQVYPEPIGRTTQKGGDANHDFWVPLLFSLVAGMSTSFGALLVVMKGRMTSNTMAFSLALAAGVMAAVSCISLIEVFRDEEESPKGSKNTNTSSSVFFHIGCFLVGSGFYFLLSKYVLPDLPDTTDFAQKHPGDGFGIDSGPEDQGASVAATLGSVTTGSGASALGRSRLSPQVMEASPGVASIGSDEEQRRRLTGDVDEPPMNNVVASSKGGGNSGVEVVLHRDHDLLDSLGGVSKSSSSTRAVAAANGPSNDAERPQSPPSTSSLSFLQPEPGVPQTAHQKRSWRITILLFLSLLLHNFPEGLAVAISTLDNMQLGVTITFGILIHNIPEGLAIAVPCLTARPNEPWLAFGLATLSGVAEPIGAALGLLIVKGGTTGADGKTTLLPVKSCLAFVSGIMLMVVVYELIPESLIWDKTPRRYWVKAGMAAGVLVMLLTEAILSNVVPKMVL
ncbi:unnamed protein product [Amoebophrya sp. A25]|nr:unnamed protein product [Amoebophrya sp. A25]|eukprot:GSA25T00009048001.1